MGPGKCSRGELISEIMLSLGKVNNIAEQLH